MKPSRTLLLALLVALAGSALWWFELREDAKPEGDAAQTEVFPGVEQDAIEWVELAQPDGGVVRLEKRGEKWRIAKPIDFAADEFAAGGIASALADLASSTVFDPAAEDAALHPEPLGSYGLTREPRVRFAAGGKTYALRLGDPTPVAGNTYVAAEGDARVFVVPQWQTNSLTKTLQELRETRLFDFEREKVTKIALTWAGGAATLEKKGDDWRLAAPLEDAADDIAVQSLISDLQGLRAEEFLDAPPPDAELGFAAPQYRAELTLEGGASYALTLGAAREGSRVAARSGASGAVEVEGSVLERLPKSVTALRDKTLGFFATGDAKAFTLKFSGEESLVVTGTNGADGWKATPPMAPGAASALVAEIASLSGESIAAESLGEAELAAFGLAPARAQLVVRGEGEGDVAPVLADVRLGVLRAGSGLAAMRADRSVVYWVAESRASALPQSAAQFRASFAEKVEPAPPE
ncbi:MAG: DUF4340 domain-containing protein [Deltaproteobacteria bacterium]|nr:DUF4340 domain-containing protein [Deltaproteobacteria bacterium]